VAARRDIPPVLRLLTSLELTIACLAALMVLVTACTLAQVSLGTYGAVKTYIRGFFIYWQPSGLSLRLPIFPGGALVGLVLLANLLAAHWLRFERSWRKVGLWLAHLGIILLFVGEFVSGAFQVESQLPIEEGQTRSYSEDARRAELVLIDATDPASDRVYAVPQALLSRGGDIRDPRLPVTLRVLRYFPNATLDPAGPEGGAPATQGLGLSVAAFEAPTVTRDDETDQVSAYVEALDGAKSLGTWLLSSALGAPQGFTLAGRSYRLAIRPARHYLPYSLTLKDFRHDVYPGTDIPKNFSSLVRLRHPAKSEDRDVLIYMNNPLRYAGKTFFQSSFGKDDTLSVLLVVENPGWTLPYVSCVLVALGMLIHFLTRLKTGLRKA
jgi:hypothetical protein